MNVNATNSTADKRTLEQLALEHKGHESQHSAMLIIIIGCLIVFQVLILYWKRHHYRSFQMTTLMGLWLFPFIISITHSIQTNIRFEAVWLLFTAGNLWICKQAMQQPLDHQTPRLVYAWFKRIYQLCYSIGLFGYLIIMGEVFGVLQLVLSKEQCIYWFATGVLCLVYGLYFGLLGKDTAELLADRMASSIGYYNKSGLPVKHLRANVCSICGDTVDNTRIIQSGGGNVQSVTTEYDGSNDNNNNSTGGLAYQLDCRHLFHESCIRGWCLIGKKSICPYCKEKVDMKQFVTNPWETQQELYLNLLDFVRYLVVWQPLVLIFAQAIIKLSGLK